MKPGPVPMGRIVGLAAWLPLASQMAACQLSLSVDDYTFSDADAGVRDVASVRPQQSPDRPTRPDRPPAPATSPSETLPMPAFEPSPAGDASVGNDDAGVPVLAPPAPLWVPRPVVVDVPLVELALVGTGGGEERLGACRDGVLIGLRQVANPNPGQWGERITFVEPICARLYDLPPVAPDPSGARVTVAQDDTRVVWSAPVVVPAPPDYAAPPEGVVWTPLEPLLCPPSAPVVVGLYGQYDVAPDDDRTSIFPWMALECAPLSVTRDGIDVVAGAAQEYMIEQTATFPWIGETPYESLCPPGAVATQLRLYSGYWLDGYRLGCATVRRADVVGGPCTLPRECQSGVCGGDGRCAR